MNANKFNNLMAGLLLTILIFIGLCIIAAATLGILKLTTPQEEPPVTDSNETDTQPPDTPVSVIKKETQLAETADAGSAYIDKMIFFGESTTAHLKSRGVLRDGTETKQVWMDSSYTKMLSSRITSEPIVYPPTGESLTIAKACEKEQPEYLVLSFGLNGITGFIADKNSYVTNYGKLIRAVQTASPNTKIILQTVYPVCKADNYNVDVDTLNSYIMTLNSWLPEIAEKYENVRIADTASVLRDENGWLLSSYDNSGDGIHLTAAAYEKILGYLRTHAWQ